MKVLVLADIDAWYWKHGQGKADVIVSCGDVPDSLVLDAAKSYQCREILAVKGNHDSSGPFPPGITDLHLGIKTIGGVTFGGFNGCWKYKPRGHFLYEQFEVERFLATFPLVDVFVAHNSPYGIHVRDDDVHLGFKAFNVLIRRTKPKLFLHGHQHINRKSMIETTRVLGVFGHRMIEV